MKIKFGYLIDKSWVDYRNNFKEIFKFILIFAGIPALFFLVVQLFLIFLNDSWMSIMNRSISFGENFAYPSGFWIFITVSVVVLSLFYLFIGAGLISVSLKRKRIEFRDLVKFGCENFLRYFMFSILMGFFLILLSLLLVIPGIIFGIFWIFGVYVLLSSNNNILQSLRKSRKIVKGNWWRVFGYVIFLLIIFQLIILIMALPFQLVVGAFSYNGVLPSWVVVFNGVVNTLMDFLSILLGGFFILFLKNFYFELKKNKK